MPRNRQHNVIAAFEPVFDLVNEIRIDLRRDSDGGRTITKAELAQIVVKLGRVLQGAASARLAVEEAIAGLRA